MALCGRTGTLQGRDTQRGRAGTLGGRVGALQGRAGVLCGRTVALYGRAGSLCGMCRGFKHEVSVLERVSIFTCPTFVYLETVISMGVSWVRTPHATFF